VRQILHEIPRATCTTRRQHQSLSPYERIAAVGTSTGPVNTPDPLIRVPRDLAAAAALNPGPRSQTAGGVDRATSLRGHHNPCITRPSRVPLLGPATRTYSRALAREFIPRVGPSQLPRTFWNSVENLRSSSGVSVRNAFTFVRNSGVGKIRGLSTRAGSIFSISSLAPSTGLTYCT
jgi:hypothetical protein